MIKIMAIMMAFVLLNILAAIFSTPDIDGQDTEQAMRCEMTKAGHWPEQGGCND